jgi:two-component system CheB/CheR fusion protein
MAKKLTKSSPAKAAKKNVVKKKKSEAAPEIEESVLTAIHNDRPPSGAFPVVGIGASAGGLEAFTQLLHALPPDTGMSFVFIQHLDPKHVSMLTQLLTRETEMPVSEVTNGTRVQPDHVYVIPQNTCMSIRANRLILEPRTSRQHLPVDYFLTSLAADLKSKGIGVILSGTASDGTIGLKAIKAAGGITFAQDRISAKFGGMPQSAIDAGCVDFIQPPEKIAKELARIGSHPYVRPDVLQLAPMGEAGPVTTGSALGRILAQLRFATGVDFANYKSTTVQRRISRRMALHRIDSVDKYAEYLRSNTPELHTLYEDILINVTEFFRDPPVFQALKISVFPKIVAATERQTPIRVWVPGCSTGEEVYSIGISLLEYLEDNSQQPHIQIFATDISDVALENARTGIYSESNVRNVSPERLRRFFTKRDSGYRISKRIREVCIFAKQNVTRDPPFSKLDLISCRNVLIYLGPVLQKRVLPVFHYALRPSGFLLLGSSESIGPFAEIFSPFDKKNKIYVPKAANSRTHQEYESREALQDLPAPRKRNDWNETEVQRQADRIVLAKYAPPGVVIDENLNILQFRGHVSPFLHPAGGAASLNLLKMAPDGMLVELRNAVHSSKAQAVPVRREGLKLMESGTLREFSFEVIPFKSPGGQERRFLIVFEDGPRRLVMPATLPAATKERTFGTADQENMQLRQDLAAAKEYLQSIIEEQDASNEELRSANEEIQSSNEELQSTNEELETAKEELQSANEELNTVNEELQNRNLQLNQTGNDLLNLLTNVHIPIVMLGNDLRIRRYTPVCERILNLIPTDVGRPISDIKFRFDVAHIEDSLMEVLRTLEPQVQEIRDAKGHEYSMRLRPYRTEDNRIDGVVMVFLDMAPAGAPARTTHRELAPAYGEHLLALLDGGDDRSPEPGDRMRSLAAGLLQAQEDERRRISRELHDDLNQKIALLHVNVERMEAKAPSGSIALRSYLKLFREAVSDLSDSIRRIAYHLHPSMLDDLGLVVAAQSFCEDFSKSERIEVSFHGSNVPGSLPQDVSLCAFRVIQESLRNIAKHAMSHAAMVTLQGDENLLRLTVRDSGTGFRREDLKSKRGLGLIGMEERVRLVGGKFAIESRPGEGTRVEVQIPLGSLKALPPAS